MSNYSIHFIANQHVIYVKTVGNITTASLRNFALDAAKLLDSVEHPCYILSDLTRVTRQDTGSITEVRDAISPLAKHPRQLMSVNYGNSDKVVLNFFSNTIATLFRWPIKTFATQREAVAFLLKAAPQLDGILQSDLAELESSLAGT